MSLKKNNIQLSSTSLQLTAWYTGLLILGIFAYLLMAFFSMAVTMKTQDRHQSLKIINNYQELAHSETEVPSDSLMEMIRWNVLQDFLIVLTGKDYVPISVALPRGWDSNDIKNIGYQKITASPETWQQIPKNADTNSTDKIFRLPFTTNPNHVELTHRKISADYHLFVGKTQAEQHRNLKSFVITSLILLIPLVVLSFICGKFLTKKAMKPVKELINTIQQVRNGSVGSRLKTLTTGDEFEELTKIFNAMLDRVETVIREMGDALDSLAHDVRTPLTRMRGTVESVLQQDASPKLLHEALQDCAEESERITAIITTLLDISEIETGVKTICPEQVNLTSLVLELVDMYQIVAEDKNIELKTQLEDPPVYVEAEAGGLRQAIANIIDNGINYTNDDGVIMITIQELGDKVELIIKDSGIGIEPNVLPNIFNRLYRGPQDKRLQGVGLGLSFAGAIIRANQGEVQVNSTPGQGTEFKIILKTGKK